MKRNCYVAIDFDGVCVTDLYPKIGADIGADVWLRPAVKLDAKLILHTYRTGPQLEDALRWFKGHSIDIWAINGNTEQDGWTSSRKLFYHAIIDRVSVATPTRRHKSGEVVTDWEIVGPELLKKIAGVLGPLV